MLFKYLTLACAAVSTVSAAPAAQSGEPISGPYLPTGTDKGNCTKNYRLRGAKQIIYAYNLVAPGASAAAFRKVPFADDCHTYINPNGGPAIPVAIDRPTTYDFALGTRQLFSRVTGQYTDYDNGTTIIHTNVTLGALHSVAVPVTFYADVYLFYNDECLQEKIQVFAQIPTRVDGVIIKPPILNQMLLKSDLYDKSNLPVKRDAGPEPLDMLDIEYPVWIAEE